MKYLFLIITFLSSFNLLYSEIVFKGLIKLSDKDLQSLTQIDLKKQEYSNNEINQIINDLYDTKLIIDIDYSFFDKKHFFIISESPIIENIFINGNTYISDEQLLLNISSKSKNLFDKGKITSDINLILSLYRSLGYNSTSIDVKTEKFNNKVNIIFSINEGYVSKLKNISFYGNKTYSDNYIYSLIKSKPNNFYNIFTSGSNLNPETFVFDKSRIIKFYKSKGFFDVNVSYDLSKNSLEHYDLNFYIQEGDRLKINDINYEFLHYTNSEIFKSESENFLKKIKKNDGYFDGNLINNHLINLNEILYSINSVSNNFTYNFLLENNNYNLYLIESKTKPKIVNSIIISGNSITKDKTLRSKISIEPGDYFNDLKIEKSQSDLSKLKYVNSVKISKFDRDDMTDIEFKIDENTKTGNFLLGGNFSGDTGFGIGLGLKDYNIFGTGNELDLTINANAEKSLFSVSYSQYNLLNSNIINSYTLFNKESDLSSSFGFKTRNQGLSYGLTYSVNETLSLSLGAQYETIEGHSPSNNNSYITDNIKDFNQVVLNFTIDKNTTNNYLYPTNGYQNKFSVKISPEEISDDSYYRALMTNKIYKKFEQSDNFVFLTNNLGIADSFNGNLKTINAFSLGGLNFKGFDYRGLGPINNKIYLGGNKYFATTLGYGSSFLFDDKDNINLKIFTTFGSIWDSDYSSNNDFELRSSAGISFDLLTAVGPISFSYAVPLQREDNDKIREFNFSIGTSF